MEDDFCADTLDEVRAVVTILASLGLIVAFVIPELEVDLIDDLEMDTVDFCPVVGLKPGADLPEDVDTDLPADFVNVDLAPDADAIFGLDTDAWTGSEIDRDLIVEESECREETLDTGVVDVVARVDMLLDCRFRK